MSVLSMGWKTYDHHMIVSCQVNYFDVPCVLCPSRISKTGDAAEGFTFSRKCLNQRVNRWVWIQLDGWRAAMASGGAPFIRRGLINFRGNIIRGGTNVPPALIHKTMVTYEPLSAEDIATTSRLLLSNRT